MKLKRIDLIFLFIFDIMFICASNTSGRNELEIGKTYEIFKHEHPKTVWVKIPCSVKESYPGYKTIQCYLADFKKIDDLRNDLIDKILS